MSTTTDTLDRLTRDLRRYLEHRGHRLQPHQWRMLADDALTDYEMGLASGYAETWDRIAGAETWGRACDFIAWWVAEEDAEDAESDAD